MFESFYTVPSHREHYFANLRQYLLTRLEHYEGQKEPTVVVVPKDGDLDDLDAYFDNQEKDLEKMKQAIAAER